MNWYKNLPPFLRAVIERMIRGGIAGIVAGYVAGTLVFDTLNVHTFDQVASLFIGGAVSALMISLGVQGAKKNGPALTGAEVLTPNPKVRANQTGRASAALMFAVLILVSAFLAILAFFTPAQASHDDAIRDTNWPCAGCFRIHS